MWAIVSAGWLANILGPAYRMTIFIRARMVFS